MYQDEDDEQVLDLEAMRLEHEASLKEEERRAMRARALEEQERARRDKEAQIVYDDDGHEERDYKRHRSRRSRRHIRYLIPLVIAALALLVYSFYRAHSMA